MSIENLPLTLNCDQNFLAAYQKLQDQFNNSSNKLRLDTDDIRLISKITNKEVFVEFLLKYNKVHIVTLTKSGSEIEIPINPALLKKTWEFDWFARVNTPAGLAIVVGDTTSRNEKQQLWFYIIGQNGISYWDFLKTKADLEPKGFLKDHPRNPLSTYTFEKRLNKTIQMEDEVRLEKMLLFFWTLQPRAEDIINLFSSYLETLYDSNPGIPICVFKHLSNKPDKPELKNFPNLAFNFICLFKNNPKTRSKLNLLKNLFITGVFGSDLITEELLKVPDLLPEAKQILESVKHFFKAMDSKVFFDCNTHIMLSLDHHAEMTFRLFQSIMESFLEYDENYDFSQGQALLKILKEVCFDPNVDPEDKRYHYKNDFTTILTAVFGINFNEARNKTLFKNKDAKEQFFNTHFLEIFPSLQVMIFPNNNKLWEKLESNNNNQTDNQITPLPDSPLKPAFDDPFLRLEWLVYDNPRNETNNQAILKLLASIPIEQFNTEEGRDLLFFLLARNDVLKARASCKMGELIFHTEGKNSKAYLFLSKACLLGDQEAFVTFHKIYGKTKHYKWLKAFIEQFRMGIYELPQGFTTFDESNQKVLNRLENLAKFCSEIPNLALFMGFIYSDPSFPFDDAFKCMEWLTAGKDKADPEQIDQLAYLFENRDQIVYLEQLVPPPPPVKPPKNTISPTKTKNDLIDQNVILIGELNKELNDELNTQNELNFLKNIFKKSVFPKKLLARKLDPDYFKALLISLNNLATELGQNADRLIKTYVTSSLYNKQQMKPGIKAIFKQIDCINILYKGISKNKDALMKGGALENLLLEFQSTLRNLTYQAYFEKFKKFLSVEVEKLKLETDIRPRFLRNSNSN